MSGHTFAALVAFAAASGSVGAFVGGLLILVTGNRTCSGDCWERAVALFAVDDEETTP